MLRPIHPATVILLAVLVVLAACSGTTPTPEPTDTPAPSPIAAATPVPATAPAPTETPSPTPTERPTAAPTPTTPSSPTAPGLLVPLDIQDPQALESSLSDAELDCIGSPERLARTLAGPGMAPREEQAELLGCLEDETLARLFLAGFVPGPEPLSPETSQCVRAAFKVIDPRTVMTAGIEGDPGRAMAGSMAAFMITTACLNDEKWEQAAPEMGMSPQDREAGQCLMEALGGPGQMAEAIVAAQEGDFEALTGAGEECGLDLGPPPGQAPTGPSPAPTPVPLPTQVDQAPSQAQDIPALTDSQVAKMKESISGDPILTVMLQGGYTINDYGPWVAADRTFIGAIAEILLTTPTDYQGSLPMVGFEPTEDGSKEYLSGTLNITASGIKTLIILVDIAEEEVVGIEIGESDTLTFSPDGK